MLSAFNGKDDCWTGAKYNILQVAMAFPLLINFNSKSTLITKILREDKHPLAMLSQERRNIKHFDQRRKRKPRYEAGVGGSNVLSMLNTRHRRRGG